MSEADYNLTMTHSEIRHGELDFEMCQREKISPAGDMIVDIRPTLLMPQDMEKVVDEIMHFWHSQQADQGALNATLIARFGSYCFPSPESIKKGLENSYIVSLMKLLDGSVAGYAEARKKPPSEQVAEVAIVISPEFRRQGFGIQLLEHLQTQCSRSGITSLTATVSAYNEAILNLIRQHGIKTLYDRQNHCYFVQFVLTS